MFVHGVELPMQELQSSEHKEWWIDATEFHHTWMYGARQTDSCE